MSEHEDSPPESQDEPRDKPARRRPPVWRIVLDLLLAAALVFGGIRGAQELTRSKPRARRERPPRRPALVEVMPVTRGPETVVVHASGNVVPARELALFPQVRGNVLEVHPALEPGGLLDKDAEVVRIDPEDYQLAVSTARSALVQAKAQLQLEQGQRRVAKRELKVVGDGEHVDRQLVLREPQLAAAKAAVSSARAALEKARVALGRTTIHSPFDAVVRSRTVHAGSRVTEATALATLVDRGVWWVEVSLPVDQLRWLKIPRRPGEPGSPARIYDEAAWEAGESRAGEVVQQGPDLDKTGRLARLFVAVRDPLSLDPASRAAPRLNLDSWVRVELDGIALESVVALDRGLLHDGDNVWVMTPEGTLDIRRVTIAYGTRQRVFINEGLADGERVVTSDLPAPVAGMKLRTREDAPEKPATPRGSAAAAEQGP